MKQYVAHAITVFVDTALVGSFWLHSVGFIWVKQGTNTQRLDLAYDLGKQSKTDWISLLGTYYTNKLQCAYQKLEKCYEVSILY